MDHKAETKMLSVTHVTRRSLAIAPEMALPLPAYIVRHTPQYSGFHTRLLMHPCDGFTGIGKPEKLDWLMPDTPRLGGSMVGMPA